MSQPLSFVARDDHDTLRRAVDLRLQGESLRSIARRLNEDGHQTRRGGRWHPSTVAALLRRALDEGTLIVIQERLDETDLIALDDCPEFDEA